MSEWSTDRVLGLAPDASSAKAGRDLAKAAKWGLIGRAESALWGEIKGSGKEPYRVRIDLGELGFKCSCPSRKFPCKHALGLMLVLAETPGAVAAGEPPAWVSEWLAERVSRQQKRIERAQAKTEEPADPQAQARRAAQRKAKVDTGVEELRLWLNDLVRRGLAAAQTQPHAFWESVAARMIDAQAPGLARMVREMGAEAGSGAGWQARLLTKAGRLHLLLNAYDRIEKFPEPLRADVQSLVGWTVPQDELLLQTGLRDAWTVVGRVIEEEDRLRVQRSWLHGSTSGRTALVLHFAAGAQVLDTSLAPGTCIDAELVFFPSATPSRAIVKTRHGIVSRPGIAGTTIDDAIAARATALAQNPWIERWPMALRGVTPFVSGSKRTLRDESGRELPMRASSRVAWQLLSISGGAPIGVFGEWDGRALAVLSAWTDDAFLTLAAQEAGARLRVA